MKVTRGNPANALSQLTLPLLSSLLGARHRIDTNTPMKVALIVFVRRESKAVVNLSVQAYHSIAISPHPNQSSLILKSLAGHPSFFQIRLLMML